MMSTDSLCTASLKREGVNTYSTTALTFLSRWKKDRYCARLGCQRLGLVDSLLLLLGVDLLLRRLLASVRSFLTSCRSARSRLQPRPSSLLGRLSGRGLSVRSTILALSAAALPNLPLCRLLLPRARR